MPPYELICPICDGTALLPEVFNDVIQHAEREVPVQGLERYICPDCGADPMFPDQLRRNQLRLVDARRRATGLLTGDEIRTIRETCGLTQQDAAAALGGGKNGFSKYERGEVTQSDAMDNLLRVMVEFPEVSAFLRRRAGLEPAKASSPSASLPYAFPARMAASSPPAVVPRLDSVRTVVSLEEYRVRRYA